MPVAQTTKVLAQGNVSQPHKNAQLNSVLLPVQNQRPLNNTIILERPPSDTNRITTPAGLNFEINPLPNQSLGNDQTCSQQQEKQKTALKQTTCEKKLTNLNQAAKTTDSNSYQFLQTSSSTTASRREPVLASNNELQQQTFLDVENYRLYNSMPDSCYNSLNMSTAGQHKV